VSADGKLYARRGLREGRLRDCGKTSFSRHTAQTQRKFSTRSISDGYRSGGTQRGKECMSWGVRREEAEAARLLVELSGT
jgi:hypothetical protein